MRTQRTRGTIRRDNVASTVSCAFCVSACIFDVRSVVLFWSVDQRLRATMSRSSSLLDLSFRVMWFAAISHCTAEGVGSAPGAVRMTCALSCEELYMISAIHALPRMFSNSSVQQNNSNDQGVFKKKRKNTVHKLFYFAPFNSSL